MRKNITLLHGWGASTVKLNRLETEFEKLGWATMNLKLPGFDFPFPEFAWGLKDYSEYVGSKSLNFFGGEKFFVFGHSFGGRIAIKMASESPKHLEAVILCSPGGISRGNKFLRLFFFLLAKAGKVLLVAPPLGRLWRKILYKLAKEHDYEKTQGVMREVFKKVIAEDLRILIPKINLPTLILWGKNDKVTNVSDAYFIKKKLPHSTVILYEDEGHKLPYNKPKEVAYEVNKWAMNLK